MHALLVVALGVGDDERRHMRQPRCKAEEAVLGRERQAVCALAVRPLRRFDVVHSDHARLALDAAVAHGGHILATNVAQREQCERCASRANRVRCVCVSLTEATAFCCTN